MLNLHVESGKNDFLMESAITTTGFEIQINLRKSWKDTIETTARFVYLAPFSSYSDAQAYSQ